MNQSKTDGKSGAVGRRSFMKLGGLAGLAGLLSPKKILAAGEWGEPGIDGNIMAYWHQDPQSGRYYPNHKTVDAGDVGNGILRAKVDGRWRKLSLTQMEQKGRDFLSGGYVEMYEKLQEEFVFGGIHTPCIITHGGIRRGDSQFTLNGAYKSVLPCPKEEYIDEIINGLLARPGMGNKDRYSWFQSQLADQDKWNWSIVVGADETVAPPDRDDMSYFPHRESHTFRNIMANPLTVVVFANVFDSFELRCVCHYVDYRDTRVSAYERKINEYIVTLGNVAHNRDEDFPGMIYYIIEEFDNSITPGSQGIRLARLRNGMKKLYNKMPWRSTQKLV